MDYRLDNSILPIYNFLDSITVLWLHKRMPLFLTQKNLSLTQKKKNRRIPLGCGWAESQQV